MRIRPPRIAASILTVAILLSLTARGASAAPSFEQANTSFASGDYRAAIAQYQSILKHDGFSAPVLFNLGNAFYRDGQFGAAILSFERAQVLAPRDSKIAANLRLACQKAGVPAPQLNEIETASRFLCPNTLAWIGSIALIVICVGIGMNRFFPRLPYVKSVLGLAVLALIAVASTFAIRWPQFQRAIVVTAEAPARIAPASTAAESFKLKAGEPLSIAKTYGNFILARTPDGRSGWVSEKEIGRVFARHPVS